MEIEKQKIKQRLTELNQVKPLQWTAMELHPKRPLLSRVHRQEVRRYQQSLEAQKIQLNQDLKRVENYLKSMRDREEYFKRKKAFESKDKKLKETKFLEQAPVILPKPTIVLKPTPIFRETRLGRYRR